MAEQTILQIHEAELQARTMIESARKKAISLVADAQEEAAEDMMKFTELCERQAAQQKLQSEAAIRAKSVKFSEDTAEQCIEVKEKLLLRKLEAITALLHMITA